MEGDEVLLLGEHRSPPFFDSEKTKLPHGLTVHELKEMTKARLEAEAVRAPFSRVSALEYTDASWESASVSTSASDFPDFSAANGAGLGGFSNHNSSSSGVNHAFHGSVHDDVGGRPLTRVPSHHSRYDWPTEPQPFHLYDDRSLSFLPPEPPVYTSPALRSDDPPWAANRARTASLPATVAGLSDIFATPSFPLADEPRLRAASDFLSDRPFGWDEEDALFGGVDHLEDLASILKLKPSSS